LDEELSMRRAVVRLAPDLIFRLDALAGRLRTRNPDRSCSRAAVVRALVTAELATIEEGDEKFAELADRMCSARRRS
jgi:hypothetical protein